MLSIELYDKLDENLLYKMEPDKKDSYTYHCKNWTFRVKKYDDGSAWMIDTYYNSWDSHKIQITDDNYHKFDIVFDFRNVEQIQDNEVDEYDEGDLFRVATSSGGYSCGRLYWKNKNTKKSKRRLIEKYSEKVKRAEHDLEWARNDLMNILDGTHYKLKY